VKDDPKNQPWLYLVTGVVAIAAAGYFLSIDASILDWAILGMGVVAVVRGVQMFLEERGQKPSGKS
jgi:uncharacterized membrane protein HdeD (DUF308 family)